VYLTEDEAIDTLSEEGITPPVNLLRLLRGIESRIDEWLNWRPALTRYVEYLTPNKSWHLYLNNYSPQSIISVKSRYPSYIKNSPEAIAEKEASPPDNEDTIYTLGVNAFWDNDSRIRINPYRNAFPSYRQDFIQFEVTYYAGLDPLPRIFTETVYEVLLAAVENGNSLGFLHDPTSDTQSLSLPGGLSESKKLGDTKSSNYLERLLQPLSKYRRTLFIGESP
jgi:hypothetical protein